MALALTSTSGCTRAWNKLTVFNSTVLIKTYLRDMSCAVCNWDYAWYRRKNTNKTQLHTNIKVYKTQKFSTCTCACGHHDLIDGTIVSYTNSPSSLSAGKVLPCKEERGSEGEADTDLELSSTRFSGNDLFLGRLDTTPAESNQKTPKSRFSQLIGITQLQTHCSEGQAPFHHWC